MSEESAGYDLNLFLNQNEAKKYLCLICHSVFKDATSIECNAGHLFCKQCLDDYFNNVLTTKQCPYCREGGLHKKAIRANKFVNRRVNDLMVKCELNCKWTGELRNCELNCKWTGELRNLPAHISQDCPLFIIVCEHCNTPQRRYHMQHHDNTCSEKLLLCPLNCKIRLKRRVMKKHKREECPMKQMTCDDCKESVLRKNMSRHKEELCEERLCECQFAEYGCNEKIKIYQMDAHLTKNQLYHLQLQVKYQKMKIQYLQSCQSMVDKDNILFLLKSGNAYIAQISARAKQQIQIESFMKEEHYFYCIENNIGFNDANRLGFETKDIDVISNRIVFGISPKKISVLCLERGMVCKTFSGDTSIKYAPSMYSKDHGLLLIGGETNESTDDKRVDNQNVSRIEFHENQFTIHTIAKLPYCTTNASTCIVNQNLFVGGGWCRGKNLSSCCMYNFENKQWTYLKNMNRGYQSSGICWWKGRGNTIVIGGGFPDIRNVEEYDMHKNIWFDLPRLTNTYPYYPLFLPSNNILFCIGGVRRQDDILGHIELYDPRDRTNKWIYVDTVENYFNLPKDGGAAHNCFLSLN